MHPEKCEREVPPVSSLHLVRVHWVAAGDRQTTGVPLQPPLPLHVSFTVQFLPSLQAVATGRKVGSHSPEDTQAARL
jgi:hypothetical protein